MNFEDLENMKHNFTIYNVSGRPSVGSSCKTLFVVRKKETAYTRLVVAPQVYGAKHHFKLLVHSLFSKLKFKHV